MSAAPSPALLVLDVNETLTDLRPLAGRFVDVGAPAHLVPRWFATVLRDGFGLAAAGASAPFADLAADAVRTVLHGEDLDRDLDAAVDHVLAGLADLPLHPDVAPGLRALRDAGHRVVALTNGAAAQAERLLDRGGVLDDLEAVLSVEDAGAWKPARAAYEHAARTCGVPLAAATLVACHPWDVDGAARAGLGTAWVDRTGSPYPRSLTAPDLRVTGLDDLARRLGRRAAGAGRP